MTQSARETGVRTARLQPWRSRGWRPSAGGERNRSRESRAYWSDAGSWRLLAVCAVLALMPGTAAADASDGDPSASDPGKAQEVSLDDRLNALLSEAVAAEEYRHTRKCLSRNAYRKIKVLNEDYMLFSKGEEYWINKLRRRCPSLKFNDLPVFVQKGTSSLCESDPFYPTNSMDLSMSLSGGRAFGAQGICYLGDFEQISAEQAALLRDG